MVFDPEPSRYGCSPLFQHDFGPIPPAIVAEITATLPDFDTLGSPIQRAGVWSSLERLTHLH